MYLRPACGTRMTCAPAPPVKPHSQASATLHLLNLQLLHTHVPTLPTTLHRFQNTNRIVDSPKASEVFSRMRIPLAEVFCQGAQHPPPRKKSRKNEIFFAYFGCWCKSFV